MNDKELKIALIGCGNMAAYYAYNLNKTDQVSITACCDPSLEKLKRFQEKWNIPGGSVHWENLLKEDIDGIINCTVDKLHDEIYGACVNAGIPLLSEKPFAVSFDTLKDLNPKLLSNHLFLINFSKRSIPAVAAARQFVRSGGLGTIHRMEIHYRQGWVLNHDYGDWKEVPAWLWRLSNDYSHYGVLGDLGSHAFDLASFFCGPIKSVCSRQSRIDKGMDQYKGKKLDSPDNALSILVSGDGTDILTNVSRTAMGEKDSLEIRINGDIGSIILNPEDSKDSYSLYMTEQKDWKTVACSRNTAKTHQLFLAALRAGLPQEAPIFRDALVNHVTIEAAAYSSDSGRTVDIDLYGKEKLGPLWMDINKS